MAGLPLGGKVLAVNGVAVSSKAEIVAQLKAASAGGSGNTAIFLCQLPEGVPDDGV